MVGVRGSLRTAMMAAALSAVTALPATAAAEPLLPSSPIGALTYTVRVNKPEGGPGYIYYTTGLSAAAVVPGLSRILSDVPVARPANVVLDKSGRELWRYDPPAGQDVSNFRAQTYQGERVLTWWQGTSQSGHGAGVDYIADEHGHVIRTLTPGDGLDADVHEFRLTPDGRALITSYRRQTADLTAIGGPANGTMLDAIASVVDVATGRVLFRWSAAEHVPLADTTEPDTLSGGGDYDPYHMNSISLDPRGNLLISLRNTSAVYDVDIRSGAIDWQLGGKHSTLDLGPGIEFAYQHDAEFADADTVRLFDNNSSGSHTLGHSSVEWIRVDPREHRATLVRNQPHPDGLVAFAMGDAQGLDNGDTFVGWGMAPHISEFSPAGDLVYDAALPMGTYRAYLEDWVPTSD
ncbi:arylsulfotransferase family protein [Nocardia sp. alder85J]|uniref:arylsulfotransferase family protein n=1 Tax=Nocardia sp. alder85J TaxID=2862949 RepID=UPI001CD1E1AF|nr:arylsulfotransferase family protein [Nocardia sp. alder85J]MCX4092696.1 arylsulfotransferase family protein [Nocardia sp. alder85J]